MTGWVVPNVGAFPLGVRDTTVQRYLRVNTPVDTLTDSLIVTGVVTDASNNADTVRVRVEKSKKSFGEASPSPVVIWPTSQPS